MTGEKLRAKAILLDLDGTIVDSREAYLKATKRAFAKIGKCMVDTSIVTEIPKRLEQNLPIEDLITGFEVREFLKAYLEAYYRATATKARPVLDASRTLSRLSEKAKLAIITMRCVPKRRLIRELERFGLAKYFHCVMTGLDVRNPKPSPEALVECARQLDVKTCECIVVGDSVTDVKAGKSAGMKTVAVLSGIFSREELATEKPDLILENISQLPDFLE